MLAGIDDRIIFFRKNFYDSTQKKVICILQTPKKEQILNVRVDNPNIIYNMKTFDIIYFFVTLISIRIDLYSLFYKPVNYGNFYFNDNGTIISTMYNKMIIAYCYFDNINKQYVIPNENIFNKKYFFKYFKTNNFFIFDNLKTVKCYNKSNVNSNFFIVFLKVYYKHLEKIHCLIKYKIHM